jgi:hypothetical protein
MLKTTSRGLPLVAASVTPLAALILGCSDGTTDPSAGFGSLTVLPTSAAICTVAPDNAVKITVTPRGPGGEPIIGLGQPSFTSSNASVAEVDEDGMVIALAAGITQIKASLTASGTTHAAEATITVAAARTGDVTGAISGNHQAPHVAMVTAAQLAIGAPQDIDIQGQAFHSHTLLLTSAHMMKIAAGCRTSHESSVDPHSDGSGAHAHTVTFN